MNDIDFDEIETRAYQKMLPYAAKIRIAAWVLVVAGFGFGVGALLYLDLLWAIYAFGNSVVGFFLLVGSRVKPPESS